MYGGRYAFRNVSECLEKKEDATAILKTHALSICMSYSFSPKFSQYNSLCLFIKLKFDTLLQIYSFSLLLSTKMKDSCDWSDSLSELCYSKPLALLIFHAIGACRSLLDSRVLKGFQVHFISGARSFSASLWEPGKGK